MMPQKRLILTGKLVSQDLYDEGKIHAIGISNFSAERMADIATFNRIVPAVNQVETHMFWQQYYLHEWMEKYHISCKFRKTIILIVLM